MGVCHYGLADDTCGYECQECTGYGDPVVGIQVSRSLFPRVMSYPNTIRAREFPSSTVPYMQVVRKKKPQRGMDKKYPIKTSRDDE
ncbi:similar to An09g01510 [Aspergillus luchuensis]|uniref:Similar to An09g01510 n=1 Tax=Aspergillus kawachii TaxID=1069201 RepID=A0A146FVE4_ASPKA|nr:similar to An09g01510 [Aspergillus luchuensis]